MTDQPTTKTGQHLADIYELDEPGPFDSTRVGRIDLDDIKAIEAEAKAQVRKQILADVRGHHDCVHGGKWETCCRPICYGIQLLAMEDWYEAQR